MPIELPSPEPGFQIQIKEPNYFLEIFESEFLTQKTISQTLLSQLEVVLKMSVEKRDEDVRELKGDLRVVKAFLEGLKAKLVAMKSTKLVTDYPTLVEKYSKQIEAVQTEIGKIDEVLKLE